MINERQSRKFCRDDISKIENYEKAINDKTQTWHLHHRLELTLDGEFALTAAQLKMHDMYYNRPYYELIFLTPSEHRRLHTEGKNHPLFGKHIPYETRKKMSEAQKGEKNHFFGKHHSEETRRKLSEAKKGENHPLFGHHHSEEAKRKMSEAQKGKKRGPMSEEHRRKISEAVKRRFAEVKC